jgi:hypothetical protein
MNRDFVEQLREVISDQKHLIGREYQSHEGDCCVIGHALKLADPSVRFPGETNYMSVHQLSQDRRGARAMAVLLNKSGLSLDELSALQLENDMSPSERRRGDMMKILKDMIEPQ